MIGEKILEMRKIRGWSQEELAERNGVTRQAVSRWEANSAKPDAEKIVVICGVFGVSADYLLGIKPQLREADPAAEERSAAEKVSASIPLQLPQSKAGIDRKTVGWILMSVSFFMLIVYFILTEVSRANLLWLFWLSTLGLVMGFLMAPGARLIGSERRQKIIGYLLLTLTTLPLVAFVGYFGVMHGDWEWEIVWPVLAVSVLGWWIVKGNHT